MPISAPPTIPQITDSSTFATRSQDWVVWQANELYPAIADTATVLSLSTSSTSTTSNTIGTGSKSFTVETGKGYLAGQSLSIAYTTTPTNRMFAVVTSYNSGTGALVVDVQAIEGSGTYTAWSIALAFNGVIRTGQIEDEAVTLAKLARVGTAGQVLTSGGAGADPSYTGISDKIQPITASVGSNALTITLNPTVLDFRDSTLTSGTVNTRTISAAISVVVSSGSTLGTVNAIQNRLAVLAIDNAGTIELAVANTSGGVNLDETGVITTLAEGGAGAADSISAIYSTTARSNVPYRVVGFIESTQATAGTWATAPSKVQGAGGLSFQHINQILNGVSVSASGTSVDFTGIPSWVKRITVMYSGLSTNGSSVVQIQFGDSGGIENTDYFNSNVNSAGGGVATSTSATATGVLTDNNGGTTYVRNGMLTVVNLTGNTWSYSGGHSETGTGRANAQYGVKTLSATLDRIRITTVNGTDTFDAGSINILYE